MISSGTYNHLIEIHRKIDATGIGGTPKMGAARYEYHAKAWASRKQQTAKEDGARERTASANVLWRTWQRSDITPSDRLIHTRPTRLNGVSGSVKDTYEVIGVDHDGLETLITTVQVRV